jgi:hypothetical protein
MSSSSDLNAEIAERLAEPFEPGEIKWKPQAVKGERALAIAYIDARLVMDRLDEVFGVLGWRDEYAIGEGGSVKCRLSVRLPGEPEWVWKEDVGSPSEQPDEGDRTKAAFSDALKRAAVKFGVGRYLYRLGGGWVAYDPKSRSIPNPPALPAWARPRRKSAPSAPPAAETPAEEPKGDAHEPDGASEAVLVQDLTELARLRGVTLADVTDGLLAAAAKHYRIKPVPAELNRLNGVQLIWAHKQTANALAAARKGVTS